MTLTRFAVAVTFVLTLALVCQAQDKDKDKDKTDKTEPKVTGVKEKIVGVWTPNTKDSKTTIVEFSRDGKLKISGKTEERAFSVTGTYAITGETLRLKIQLGDKSTREETIKIKKITDKLMVTEDSRGKSEEFTKK